MKPGIPPVRVMVIDPQPLSRRGLVSLFKEHSRFTVTSAVGSVTEAREVWRKQPVDLLVTDLSLDGGEALAFIAACVQKRRNTAVVVNTSREDSDSVRRAMEAGAHGYVSRRDTEDDLLRAIAEALLGHRHMGSRVEHGFLKEVASGQHQSGELRRKLSGREWEVFCRCGEGRTAKEIGESLKISQKTAETHLRRIRTKLRVGTLRDLHVLAVTVLRDQGE